LDPLLALLPLVDLETLAAFVVDLDPFGAALSVFVLVLVGFDPFVLELASCVAARLAKSSCLLEQPVASKIRLMVGDVSSSIVAREVFEDLDPLVIALAVDVRDAGGAMEDDKQGRVFFAERAFRSF